MQYSTIPNDLGQFDFFISPGKILDFATSPTGISTGLQLWLQRRGQDIQATGIKKDAQQGQARIESDALTAQQRLLTDIEIERLRAQAAMQATKDTGMFGLSQTKILAITGVVIVGIMGLTIYAKTRKSL